MIGKKSLAAAGVCALIGCAAMPDMPAYAASNTPVRAETTSDMPTHVVEGGDFKVATLQPDRLLETYRLTKYDVIDVQVIGLPSGAGMSDVMIGPDGYAQLPYVGSVKLAGMTLDEAKAVLIARMSEYLHVPDLSLLMRSYGARKVYVMGEVNAPGMHELGADSLNSYAAIASAGGFTSRGLSTKVEVLRVVGDTMYHKKINIKDYVKKHDLTQNVVLQDGDIIYVPRFHGIKVKEDILPYVGIWAMYKSLTK
mgnify:FL=1